jgi:hypothetical protein
MVQLSHVVLVLALVAGAYFLLVRRNSTDSATDSSSANGNGFVNGSGLKGANSGTTAALDTGRDFVAALEQAVSPTVCRVLLLAQPFCFLAIDEAERARIGARVLCRALFTSLP